MKKYQSAGFTRFSLMLLLLASVMVVANCATVGQGIDGSLMSGNQHTDNPYMLGGAIAFDVIILILNHQDDIEEVFSDDTKENQEESGTD